MEFVSVAPSQAHTMGNITSFTTEFVKGLFPKDYFSTVNITSKIAYRHFNILHTAKREFIKKRKPILIVRPRLDIDNQDTWMNNTFFTTRITDLHYNDGENLQEFYTSPDKTKQIRYLLNRNRIYFDITILLETQMEQYNMIMLLKNRIRQDRPFFLDAHLESHVPRAIMEGLAKDTNIPFENTAELLDHINTNSTFPVTYKMKNSTGRDEFFRFYPCQIDTELQGLNMDDGSKKNMVDDTYAINFSIKMEYFTSGLYYYFSPEFTTLNDIVNEPVNPDAYIEPAFTTDITFDSVPTGWNLYMSPIYKISNPDDVVLPFESLMTQTLKNIIRYHLDNNIPLDACLDYKIMRDSSELVDGTDYEIDFEKLTITTHAINTTSTYRFIVYINSLYINNLIDDNLGFSDEK